MRQKKVLYMQVADQIRQDILDGIYPVGCFIPTEIELEDIFKVSKITVRKAIELLATDGYVKKKSGVGTVVLSNRLFNKLSKAVSFSSIIEKEGKKLSKEILSLQPVSLVEGDKLFSIFGKQALLLTRLYRLDGSPYALFEHYLPFFADQDMMSTLTQSSLYKWLAQHQKFVTRFQDCFRIAVLSEQQKNILTTDEDKMLQRTRTSYTQDHEIIEVSHAFYDSEIYPYMIEYEI